MSALNFVSSPIIGKHGHFRLRSIRNQFIEEESTTRTYKKLDNKK